MLDRATTCQEQINIFNSHSQNSLFFLHQYDNEIAVSYNRCAIYHLLDQISYLLSFIRRTEPDYVVSLSDDLELKNFDAMVKRHRFSDSTGESDLPYSERTLLLYKQTLLLKRLFPDTFIDISPDFIKDYADKIAHYESLFDDSPDRSFIDEQLSWLELDSSRLSSGDMPLENNSDTLLAITSPNIEDFTITHAVSETELQQHITGKNEKYVANDFLQKHGFLKDSAEAKMISDTYFDGQPLMEHVNKFTCAIDGSDYALISRNSNASGHKTYYLFIQKTL